MHMCIKIYMYSVVYSQLRIVSPTILIKKWLLKHVIVYSEPIDQYDNECLPSELYPRCDRFMQLTCRQADKRQTFS